MELPISEKQARKAALWLKANFGKEIEKAVKDTPFSADIICGIICQETAYFWVGRTDKLSIAEVLARCVLDASGDVSGKPRSVFPKNTAAFREKYGDEFTRMLIEEANKTRALRGFMPAKIVYKGYGILQYDLQFVTDDEDFFRLKKWYDFSECLRRAMTELNEKYKIHKNLKKAVKAYNGRGEKAEAYAENVLEFARYCSQVNP